MSVRRTIIIYIRVRLWLTVWQIRHESCGRSLVTWPQSATSAAYLAASGTLFLISTCGCVHVSVCFGAADLTSGSCYVSGRVQRAYFRRVLGHVMYNHRVFGVSFCSTPHATTWLPSSSPLLFPELSPLLPIPLMPLSLWWDSLNSFSYLFPLYRFYSLFSLLSCPLFHPSPPPPLSTVFNSEYSLVLFWFAVITFSLPGIPQPPPPSSG